MADSENGRYRALSSLASSPHLLLVQLTMQVRTIPSFQEMPLITARTATPFQLLLVNPVCPCNLEGGHSAPTGKSEGHR